MSAAASPALDALTQKHLSDLITRALEEDVGSGDITTESTVPEDSVSRATFLAKDDGVLSGLTVADQVFATVDPELKVRKRTHKPCSCRTQHASVTALTDAFGSKCCSSALLLVLCRWSGALVTAMP
jgi:nicotinate-nucleotide pyrophosphorylase